MSEHNYHSKVLDGTEVQLLTEVGLMACGAGNVKNAESIFEGLSAVRPNQPAWLIGLAMSRLEAGAAHEAAAMMGNASDLPFFRNPEYTVFYSMCLIAAGRRSEAERLLHEQLSNIPADCAERALALALLGRYLAERHIVASPHALAEAHTSQFTSDGSRSHHVT